MRKGDLIDCGNHNIPFGKNIKYDNVRIKFDGVNYWMSLSVKTIIPIVCNNTIDNDDDVVGIDIGIRTSAYLSNGKSFDGPNEKRLRILDDRLRKIQSAVDRDRRKRFNQSISTKTKYYDIPKSKNQIKRETKLAKTRNRIINIYKSRYHKISREIANEHYKTIVLEDLGVSSIIQNAIGKDLRNNLYQGRLATLSEYISYKCRQEFTTVIYADRDFPSSQICSCCGSRYKIGKEKIYSCPVCGLVIDRDLNASINLKNFGLSSFMT